MRTAFLSALSLLTLSAAAFNVSVTFHGATEDESYSLLFPTDTTAVQIGTCSLSLFQMFPFASFTCLLPFTPLLGLENRIIDKTRPVQTTP